MVEEEEEAVVHNNLDYGDIPDETVGMNFKSYANAGAMDDDSRVYLYNNVGLEFPLIFLFLAPVTFVSSHLTPIVFPPSPR